MLNDSDTRADRQLPFNGVTSYFRIEHGHLRPMSQQSFVERDDSDVESEVGDRQSQSDCVTSYYNPSSR